LNKGDLEGMKVVVARKSLDGRYVSAVVHQGKRQAGQYALAVEQDGACAARALIASLLGSGEVEELAQNIKQRLARINVQLSNLAIDRKRYGGHGACRPCVGDPPGRYPNELTGRQAASSWSDCLASFRSSVPKPSVNQPYVEARRS
jgi:hypothetical protein